MDDVEPVVEILAEAPGGDLGPQVLVGGGDDPHVDVRQRLVGLLDLVGVVPLAAGLALAACAAGLALFARAPLDVAYYANSYVCRPAAGEADAVTASDFKLVGKEKVGDIKQPDPGFVDAIRARVTDKIRAVKGKPGKADRNEAVKAILDEVLSEMAPAVTDPKASYLAFVEQKTQATGLGQWQTGVSQARARGALAADAGRPRPAG